ncbi:MAG: hypothetical protein QM780_15800 [Hyphomicrobium sp.]|uniref:hypothetical protein n=1 Tax=Hyphomicrobium sp. TaxID=82 RepID=UPI0039E4440A
MVRVTIHSVGRGKAVTSLNENPLVTVPTSVPMYASCRALVALGYLDGPVEFVRAGSDMVTARIGSIHAGAKLTVQETDKGGLRVVPYRPFEGVSGSLVAEDDETAAGDEPAHILDGV